MSEIEQMMRDAQAQAVAAQANHKRRLVPAKSEL